MGSAGKDEEDGFGKEPDASLRPAGVLGCVTIVFEVAYSETVAHLCRCLSNWTTFSGGAQYAIGLKLYPNDLNRMTVCILC